MNWKFQGLLFSLICSLGTGFILISDWTGILELIGISGLIACIVLPIPFEPHPILARFRAILFFGSSGLIFFPTFLNSSTNLSSLETWIVVISLYTTLSGTFLDLLGNLNRMQLGLILYLVSSLGIGLGYLGQLYFF